MSANRPGSTGWCTAPVFSLAGRVGFGRIEHGGDDCHQESTRWFRILEPGCLRPECRLGIEQCFQVVYGVPGVRLPGFPALTRGVHVLVEVYQPKVNVSGGLGALLDELVV